MLDEHYYNSPQWFQSNGGLYDNRTRGASKVMVGEYAANNGNPTTTMASALGDANFILGMMKNSDLVAMSMYAPLLVNVNGVQWSPDLIGFDNTSIYGSPSYWAQVMLANNHGGTVVGGTVSGATGLRTLVTRTADTYYVTVINLASTANTTTINLSGVTNVSPSGTMTTLAASAVSDVNSIASPTRVSPVTSLVSGLGTTFTRQFAGNSVTILQFAASNGALDTAAPVMVSAASVKSHGGTDETVTLPINGTVGVEGRSGGITRLVMNFNEPIVMGVNFGVTLSSGTATATVSNNQLILAISGASPAALLRATVNGLSDAFGNSSSYSFTAGILAGDTNGDRRVDFNDFIAMQVAYGSTSGTSAYNARADFDANVAVDFNDFIVLQTAYGGAV